VVTEVGAGLRSWTVAGEELLDGFDLHAAPTDFQGKLLAPWPNRIRDGRYAFTGAEHQTPLSEPDRRAALHGLVMWAAWRAVRRSAEAVTLGHVIHPRPGYPFSVRLEVEYALDAAGLGMTLRAANLGDVDAPFGAGLHPYLRPGTATVDDAVLTVPAEASVPVDERKLPTGPAIPVAGTALDFRRPRAVGGAALDCCFTGLTRDADGRARVRLDGGDRQIEVWLGPGFGHVQIYTADDVGDPARRRRSLAVEPMTCAPDAFNSGDGLQVLAPGASFTARCGLAATGVPS
jgi:aldose 1-epimerase